VDLTLLIGVKLTLLVAVKLAALVAADLASPVAENLVLQKSNMLWIWLCFHISDMLTFTTDMLALATLTYPLLNL